MLRLVSTAVCFTLILLTIVVHQQIARLPFGVVFFCDLAAIGMGYVIFKALTRGPDAGLRLLSLPRIECQKFVSFLLLGYAKVKGRRVVTGWSGGTVCYFAVVRDCLVTVTMRRNGRIVRGVCKRWRLHETTVSSVEIIQMGATHRITITDGKDPLFRGAVWRLDQLPNVVGATPECIASTVKRHFVMKVVFQAIYMVILTIWLLVWWFK